MDFALLVLLLLAMLGAVVFYVYRRRGPAPPAVAAPVPQAEPEDSAYRVSYIPPEFQWSGTTTGALPIKILTYKQYECLEDARYGFRIVGVPTAERKLPQPYKTRAHGQKTVASLMKHGFLDEDGTGGYVINDHGLNALEVCSVRY
ncbi:MAG TPA: hypothetical protein VE934_09150 [Polaromonas sp.]|uniref:hypothetical protein n=1 Tax=Polaromonas sp. TaxID=1869339 RepID=UPI002D67EC9F|nr:hypothetical protein [Polaromonas sp.]HYW57116.1 hypothetical protein [Polaromonas sp.]